MPQSTYSKAEGKKKAEKLSSSTAPTAGQPSSSTAPAADQPGSKTGFFSNFSNPFAAKPEQPKSEQPKPGPPKKVPSITDMSTITKPLTDDGAAAATEAAVEEVAVEAAEDGVEVSDSNTFSKDGWATKDMVLKCKQPNISNCINSKDWELEEGTVVDIVKNTVVGGGKKIHKRKSRKKPAKRRKSTKKRKSKRRKTKRKTKRT